MVKSKRRGRYVLAFGIVLIGLGVYNWSLIKSAVAYSPLTRLYVAVMRDEVRYDDHHVISSLKSGLPIIVNKFDHVICWFVRMEGEWDRNETAVVKNLVKPGMRVIEVGANFGVYTLQMAQQIGPKGKLYAFEANPNVSKYLNASIALNRFHDRVKLHPMAVGDKPAQVYLNPADINIGGSSIGQYRPGQSIQVAMHDLDDIVPADEKIDLLKIDAEGCEAKILAGAQRIIKQNPDLIIMMEWATDMITNQGSDVDRLLASLKSQDFKVWRIKKKNEFKQQLIPMEYAQLPQLPSSDLVLSRQPLEQVA